MLTLRVAKARVGRGVVFNFGKWRIDEIIEQYHWFLDLREQGLDVVTALLSWLMQIGVVFVLSRSVRNNP